MIQTLLAKLAHQKHLDEEYLKRWLPTFREVFGRDLLRELQSIKGGL